LGPPAGVLLSGAGTQHRYFLIPFEDGSWGWLIGQGVEERVTPVAPVRRRPKIYTPEGAKAGSDRKLEKMQACITASVDPDPDKEPVK
jgi:hypothetical protein